MDKLEVKAAFTVDDTGAIAGIAWPFNAADRTGDVIDPDEGICAIGSGGSFALAAGRALLENTPLSAREIAEKSMKIAGDICIYTNQNFTIEELKANS